MVIPVHDQNPTRRRAIVTLALIAVNIVAFVLSPISGVAEHYRGPVAQACAQENFLREYGAVPKELVTNRDLPAERVAVQTDRGRVTCPLGETGVPPWLTVLTAMFLHGGWLHLLGNMLFLWIFGNNVEDRMGRLRYLLFYLGTGYVATYVFAAMYPTSVSTLVGASGAVAGVLGAYLRLFPGARITSLVPFLLFLPLRLPAWIVLGFWFVLQWLYVQGAGVGAQAQVAYLAHVAGFVAGFSYALITMRRPPRGPSQQRPHPYGSDPYRAR
ncbi:MAG: rhomboid family intramembrane serine protease [Carbonactinosporaceae bacterium]